MLNVFCLHRRAVAFALFSSSPTAYTQSEWYSLGCPALAAFVQNPALVYKQDVWSLPVIDMLDLYNSSSWKWQSRLASVQILWCNKGLR